MRNTTRIAAAAWAALSLAAAGAVLAHPGEGWGPGYGMGQGMGYGMGYGMHGGPGMGPGARGGMFGPESPRVASARLADLKAELKITSAQEGAWQAYADLMVQQQAARKALHDQMHTQAPDANFDRAAHHEAMFKLNESQFAARTAAFKDLQAVLSPEQRVIADSLLAFGPRHHMAGRGPWR